MLRSEAVDHVCLDCCSKVAVKQKPKKPQAAGLCRHVGAKIRFWRFSTLWCRWDAGISFVFALFICGPFPSLERRYCRDAVSNHRGSHTRFELPCFNCPCRTSLKQWHSLCFPDLKRYLILAFYALRCDGAHWQSNSSSSAISAWRTADDVSKFTVYILTIPLYYLVS